MSNVNSVRMWTCVHAHVHVQACVSTGSELEKMCEQDYAYLSLTCNQLFTLISPESYYYQNSHGFK